MRSTSGFGKIDHYEMHLNEHAGVERRLCFSFVVKLCLTIARFKGKQPLCDAPVKFVALSKERVLHHHYAKKDDQRRLSNYKQHPFYYSHPTDEQYNAKFSRKRILIPFAFLLYSAEVLNP